MKYIINRQKLINTVKGFSANAKVFYPIKANTNRCVLQIIDPYVCGYEVASIYHLQMLIKKMAIDPKRILYSSPIKSKADIKRAISFNVRNFVVDNIREFYDIIALTKDTKINFILRVNILEFIDATSLTVKWGASSKDIVQLKDKIKNSIHAYKGISFYIPQELTNLNNFKLVFDGIDKKIGLSDCSIIDIGGGLTIDETSEVILYAKERYKLLNVEYYIEPGRFLLNPNIDLCVTVIEIRKSEVYNLVFIDSGIYSGLLDVIIKQRKFDVRYINNKTSAPLEEFLLCGDSSDVSDIIGIYKFPCNIKVGDELMIYGCGAYCNELDTDFCKNKRANHVIVDS